METHPEQFRDALRRIEIKGAKRQRAIDAHTEIRACLETDPQLCEWGVDTVLIGSYARDTSIHPGKDVDVFAKLTKLDISADPKRVYDTVYRVLADKYGSRAERQPRSIKVLFDTDGFAVDVVPAVRMDQRWGIPVRDSAEWSNPDQHKRWVETDPEALASLATAMNATRKVNGQGAYKPIVKLVRQIRKHHHGDQKPGGLYFELLTYWAFKTNAVNGDTFAQLLAETLRAIDRQLSSGMPLIDPVLNRPYTPQPSDIEHRIVTTLFGLIATRAEQALHQAKCPSAVTWRWIIGENDRGHCFPIPPGCDEDGRPMRDVASVSAVGPKGARGFA